MMHCCVRGCRARLKYRKGSYSFFRLPSDQDTFDLWQAAIPGVLLKHNSSQRVCSEHFTSDDVDTGRHRKCLRRTAVPSRNLTTPMSNHQNKKSKDSSSSPKSTMQPMTEPSIKRRMIEENEMVLVIKAPKNAKFTVVESSILPRKLSFNEKIGIVMEHERTKEISHLPVLFNCHMDQVMKALHCKEEIFRKLLREGIGPGSAPFPMQHVVSIIVYEFLQRCIDKPIIMTDHILQEVARDTAAILKLRGFNGNDLWLKGFKGRYRLTGVNWSSWGNSYAELEKSIDLRSIIEDLRNLHGPLVIPYPESINCDYEKVLMQMLGNSCGQISSNVNPGECSKKSEAKCEIITIPDDPPPPSPQAPSPHPCDEVLAETWPIDPMTIDSYQTALSYFRPLEEFLLSKRDPKTLSIVNQLGKVILKQAEAETQEPAKHEVLDVVPYILNEVQIDEYKDALQYLKRLDEFLLDNENMRAVGLMNQLEVILSSK